MRRLLAGLAVVLAGTIVCSIVYNALQPADPTCAGPYTTSQGDMWRCAAGGTLHWTLDQNHPYTVMGDPNGRVQLWVFVRSEPSVPAIVTASGQYVDREVTLTSKSEAFGAWTSGQQSVALKLLEAAEVYATIWKQRMG